MRHDGIQSAGRPKLVVLERRGFTKDQIKTLNQHFAVIFGEGTLEERVNTAGGIQG